MNPLSVTLNGVALNSDSTGLYLQDGIDGLSFPDVRTSSGLLSGQDGGYVGSQFFGSRYITLTGRAFSNDVVTVFQLRKQLQALLAGTLAPLVGTLIINTYDGNSYLIYVNTTKFDMPITGAMNFANFNIELLAPDPIIYDNTTGNELTVALTKLVPGGHTWPITWPIVWGAGSGPTTVVNNGTVFVLPKITLTNSHTNAVITNLTTGQVFKFAGLTTGPGDVVVIDMRQRTVTLNGGSILNKVTADSSWWGLKVGSTDITLASSSGSDNVTGSLSWRSGVMGI